MILRSGAPGAFDPIESPGAPHFSAGTWVLAIARVHL